MVLQEAIRGLTEHILVVNPDTSEALVKHIKVTPACMASVCMLTCICLRAEADQVGSRVNAQALTYSKHTAV